MKRSFAKNKYRSISTSFFSPMPEGVERVSEDVFISRHSLPSTLLELVFALRKKFTWARIYLTGAGPVDILNDKTPNDYDILIINGSILAIDAYLRSIGLEPSRRSQRYPIINCVLADGISLDFTVKKRDHTTPIKQQLEKDFMGRDFSLNALYLQFTHEERFMVFSFQNALEAHRNKVIESINDPFESFKADPTRLFRLANILIKNPNYHLDQRLIDTLRELAKIKGMEGRPGLPCWFLLIDNYIKEDYGNRDRINHAIRKLFIRHSYEQINEAFFKMKLLTSFTNNSRTSVVEACRKIPEEVGENKYIFWIMANFVQAVKNGKKSLHSPLYPFLLVTRLEQHFINYVYRTLSSGVALDDPHLESARILMRNFDFNDEPEEVSRLTL